MASWTSTLGIPQRNDGGDEDIIWARTGKCWHAPNPHRSSVRGALRMPMFPSRTWGNDTSKVARLASGSPGLPCCLPQTGRKEAEAEALWQQTDRQTRNPECWAGGAEGYIWCFFWAFPHSLAHLSSHPPSSTIFCSPHSPSPHHLLAPFKEKAFGFLDPFPFNHFLKAFSICLMSA